MCSAAMGGFPYWWGLRVYIGRWINYRFPCYTYLLYFTHADTVT